MNWSSTFFVTLLLCGIGFLLGGLLMMRLPPRTINGWYGYRTSRSMSDQHAWDVSQPIAASLMLKCGAVMTLLSFFGCFFSLGAVVDVCLALGILLFAMFVIFAVTERALRDRLEAQ